VDFLVPTGSTSAQTQIQGAIDSLSSNGGKIIILEGTYTLSSFIILMSKTNITIEGMGNSTVIKRG
jgi:polygalacturonase